METKQHPNSTSRRMVTRLAGLALLAAAATLVLAACGGSGSPHVVSLDTTTAKRTTASTSHVASTTTTPAKGGNPTELVDEWAICMRHHGDPNQTDPTIDSHGVINIFMSHVSARVSAQVRGGTGAQTGSCSQYLSAAQRLLRAANPVPPPPNQAELLAYVGCMRANGVPNYPDPTGDKANFSGTGVDPNSPSFIHANEICGKRIHAPAYWINGWGPPGDVSVRSIVGGSGSPPPPGFGG
jgi:hypothetical protein